ncbi:hypothetical protein CAEBREN_23009 [Caenorhabditis brenneri]|uniref:Uncharacterized protein n=1 Tax=Caenorhabditis brenneri TaxID=135651 RepID=G0P372_CAEBE|nr:hypothetical protein CAEBREN_23009 [Caenorhabditis brenneri]
MTIEREESVKVAERNMEDLKLDHQFNKENEPQDVQTHGENAAFGVSNKIQISNDNRSESSNVANKVNVNLVNDTSQESKEISEIQNTMDPEASGVQDDPVVIIEEKLDHQFREENVPETFQTLFKSHSIKMSGIEVRFRNAARLDLAKCEFV